MQDLSQAMVKLSCVTDDTCCRVHNTLQSVSDRLRGSGKYSIALVNAGGHECVNSGAESSPTRLSLRADGGWANVLHSNTQVYSSSSSSSSASSILSSSERACASNAA